MIKVGDRVRTTKQYNDGGIQLFPVGTIGTVVGIHDGEYRIEANREFWIYTPDMFEKLEDKPMTKSDLKDGMICIQRDGTKFMWLNGALRGINLWGDIEYEDLTGSCEEDDVMVVYSPVGETIGGILNHNYSQDEPIWERVEPKKMTIAEIEEALGYPVEVVK